MSSHMSRQFKTMVFHISVYIIVHLYDVAKDNNGKLTSRLPESTAPQNLIKSFFSSFIKDLIRGRHESVNLPRPWHVAVRMFTNRSQTTWKKQKWHKRRWPGVSDVPYKILTSFMICYWKDSRQHFIYLL